MKILTVDDSMTARLIIKNTFQPEGHDVLEAADGAAAIVALKNNGPVDAVFLDWNMPVMNGLDCLVAMRKNPAFSNVKVIMCTTEAEKKQVVTAVRAGANGYVLKPVTPDALKQQLAKACGAAAGT